MLNVRRRQYPKGWYIIKPTLDEFADKMSRAEQDIRRGQRKVDSLWPLFQIRHQQSRYIYDMFYTIKMISKELFEYCLENDIADKSLIDEWKNQGHENLSCSDVFRPGTPGLIPSAYFESRNQN